MKKRLCYSLFIGIAFLLLLFCFVKFIYPNDYPTEGVWYCDKLNMTIDFSHENGELVKVYDEDGTYNEYKCFIDFGRGLFIYTKENEMYLRGQFWLVGNTFIVNFDGKIYFFHELQNGQTPPGV